MWRVAWRLSLAELRSRPIGVALALLAVAASVALAMLSAGVADTTGGAYERLIADSDGAHAWVFSDSAGLPALVRGMPGVTAVSEPQRRIRGTLTSAGLTVPMNLWGVPGAIPSPAPTLLRSGRWLSPGAAELVIDQGFATRTHLGPGDTVLLSGPGGTREVRIVGVGVNTTGSPYPLDRPAEGFTSPAVAAAISGGRYEANAFSVRLADRDDASDLLGEVRRTSRLQVGGITWEQIQATVANASRPTTILLRAFAVFAFIASGLVLANSVSAALLGKRRQIGLLRAAGMAPGQVVLLIVGQYAALALAAASAGAAGGWLLSPLFAGRVASLLDAPRPPFDLVRAAIAVSLATAGVALFVLAPAAAAARGTVSLALLGGSRRPPKRVPLLARLAAALRLPASARLGAKDTFAHRSRAWMTVGAIALATATVLLSLTLESTGRAISEDPRVIGQPPFQLRLTPRSRPQGGIEAEAARIARTPGVENALAERITEGRIAGGETFALVGFSGAVEKMPFNIVEGRMALAQGEAVAGLGLARDHGAAVGEELAIRLNNGSTVRYLITGLTPNFEGEGRVLFYRGGSGGQQSVVVQAALGVDPGQVALAIEAAAPGRYAIDNLSAVFETDLADQRADLIAVMVTLNAGLLLVAFANLAGVMILTVRERTRELGILRAIGLTHRQLFASMAVSSAVYTFIGVALGAPAGYWTTSFLLDYFGGQVGWPAGLAQTPRLPMAAGAAAIGLLALVLFVSLPARLATRPTIREALREE